MQDMVRKGRHGSQTGVIYPKVTGPMALAIRIAYARGDHSTVTLAVIYGVTPATIGDIVKGRAHLFVGR